MRRIGIMGIAAAALGMASMASPSIQGRSEIQPPDPEPKKKKAKRRKMNSWNGSHRATGSIATENRNGGEPHKNSREIERRKRQAERRQRGA